MDHSLRLPGWMDVHCHFTPPMTPEETESRWKGMCAEGWHLHAPHKWSLQETLEYMDKRGIAMQMLSNIPRTLDALRESNSYGASLVSSYPSRFGLLAALPTDHCAATLAEIKRATDELNADGFAVTCCYNGVYLGDPSLEEAMKELDRRSAVVLVHPNAYASQVFGRPAAALEVAFETARTVINMLYAGVFRRYPNIKFIIAHCGGAFPALTGRLSLLGTEAWVPNPNNITKEEIRQQLGSLYLDTAATATAHTLGPALTVVSPDHLVYGSDSGVPCSTSLTVDENLHSLITFAGLTDAQIQDIGIQNPQGLFPTAANRL
ncbi:MAG: hypothetical protein M1818_002841 [Claussenomyces sp. TS43310]|nr:MAG: hypothetical protein M1818_002841 [Claussenomyces sp. TS43310]